MKVNSVMIVDDSMDDQYLAERSLASSKLCQNFFLKDNGLDALAFFQDYENQAKAYGNKLPPSVILLDINMPVMNGFEFLDSFKELRRKNKVLEKVIIVVFSSSDNIKDVKRARSYDFVRDYWVKSPHPDDIVEKFSKLFAQAC